MPHCPSCGADVTELVPERCRGCPVVRYWRRRAEGALLQAERYRGELWGVLGAHGSRITSPSVSSPRETGKPPSASAP